MIERKVPWWRRALDFALDGIRSGFGLFRRSEKLEPALAVGPEPALAAVPEPARQVSWFRITDAEEEIVTQSSPNSEPVKANTAQPAEEPQALHAAPEAAAVAGSVAEQIVEAEIPRSAELEPAMAQAVELSAEKELLVEEPVPVSKPPAVVVEETVIAEAVPEVSVSIAAEAEEAHVERESDPPAAIEPEIVAAAHEATESETRAGAASVLETDPVPEPVDATPAPVDAETMPAGEAGVTPAPEWEAPAEDTSRTEPAPEPASGPAHESTTAPVAPAPQPAAETIPVQQMLPLPELTPEQKTAEKVAAALKARGQDADQSPFSVMVNKVYDGPLDLLLDLIRKQDIDIYDIPIAKITAQFLAYVDRLRASDMDVAGEFIYTAALLIHIKSKMLLPRAPSGPEEQAEDPRRELVERLLEHERFKNAAQMLHEKQMLEAASWTNPGVRDFREDENAEPEIAADTTDLVRIFREILDRARNRPVLNLEEDSVTVGQMMQFLGRRLTMEDKPIALRRLLSHTKSERALIAMFLALLEMVRLQAILLRQDRQFSEIFIKKHTGFDGLMNEGLANAHDDWR